MEAIIRYVGPEGDELVEINGHKIQFGGRDGDAYCFAHESFDCAETLTEDEDKAIQVARCG